MSKTVLSESMQIPTYKESEQILGFQMEGLFPTGVPSEKVRMVKTENTRKTNLELDKKIKKYWENFKSEGSFDGDRARFEGFIYNTERGSLQINYSEEKYSTHFFMRNTIYPKPYQAQLFSINGIVLSSDMKIPIGVRNPKTTDQGKIYHIVPAGFTDVFKIVKPEKTPVTKEAEEVYETTLRKFMDEIYIQGNIFSESPHKAAARELDEELEINEKSTIKNMKVIGIIYNSRKNFDTTTSVLIPLDVDSSEINLKGDEHTELEFLDTSKHALEEKLTEFSLEPESNSGHLRGDIAALIAHLYGEQAYINSVDKVAEEVAAAKFSY